ncbi:glutaredoxin family protein [Myxococcaceae bacterium GXIMD 01537]
MRVDIYSKPACSLCEKAVDAVERARARIPFFLAVVDIRQSPELFEKWRYDIPVVFIDGEFAFKHRVDEAELEAKLRQTMDGTSVAKSGDRDE